MSETRTFTFAELLSDSQDARLENRVKALRRALGVCLGKELALHYALRHELNENRLYSAGEARYARAHVFARAYH